MMSKTTGCPTLSFKCTEGWAQISFEVFRNASRNREIYTNTIYSHCLAHSSSPDLPRHASDIEISSVAFLPSEETAGQIWLWGCITLIATQSLWCLFLGLYRCAHWLRVQSMCLAMLACANDTDIHTDCVGTVVMSSCESCRRSKIIRSSVLRGGI